MSTPVGAQVRLVGLLPSVVAAVPEMPAVLVSQKFGQLKHVVVPDTEPVWLSTSIPTWPTSAATGAAYTSPAAGRPGPCTRA